MSQQPTNRPDSYPEMFEKQRRGMEQHMKTFMEKASNIVRHQETIAQQESDRKSALAELVAQQQCEIAQLRRTVSELRDELTIVQAERDELATVRKELATVRDERDHLESVLGRQLEESCPEDESSPRKRARHSEDADPAASTETSTAEPLDGTEVQEQIANASQTSVMSLDESGSAGRSSMDS